jgi:four helix bundle protein
MSDFRKLAVWKKSHKLTLAVYEITARFPKAELFGLVSQLRRASSSIGCNIAEGLGRRGDRELLRFLRIAQGSSVEVEYQLLLAHHLGFVAEADYKRLDGDISEIGRMLTGLSRKVQQRARNTADISVSRTSNLVPRD